MGVGGSCHRHRARDRDCTTRAYLLAREPGWAQIADLGADRAFDRRRGGWAGGSLFLYTCSMSSARILPLIDDRTLSFRIPLRHGQHPELLRPHAERDQCASA